MQTVLQRLAEKQAALEQWLARQENAEELPLYSSIDVRDAGFKVAVVDTNLYPAGFNNLAESGIAATVQALRRAILNRMPGCNNVLVIAEEHTRNTWYLEHLYVLQSIIARAGFQVRVATFLDPRSEVCNEAGYVLLTTATQKTLPVYCLRRTMQALEAGQMQACFVIMNNDLTGGIPAILRGIDRPIYPSIKAGWHTRQKSRHFEYAQPLLEGFAQVLGLDPWLFSCLYTAIEGVDIHQALDRQRIADHVSDLLKCIRMKYAEHGIAERPFVFLKANRGTYGMGVMPIDEPQAVLDLNRKQRNKLHVGKGSQVIDSYLLQEGVPSRYRLPSGIAEVCLYQIENAAVGGFFRSHPEKSGRDNLNSKGMHFTAIEPGQEAQWDGSAEAAVHWFDVYRLLGRIAVLAAQREITQLEGIA